jgi:HEAT repeat protein
MDDAKSRGHQLKKKVLGLLRSADFDSGLRQLRMLPARQVVNPLLSFFCSDDPLVRWRAVTAVGAIVEDLAAKDREAARVILRRLMWSLNEESGGIGWGAAEAMGEIMARDGILAKEFASILISYIDRQGNFVEYEPLQRGVVWGLARLAQVRPDLIQAAIPHLGLYLQSADAEIRGLAARAVGLLGSEDLRAQLLDLLLDPSPLSLYEDGNLLDTSVKQIAKQALHWLDTKKSDPGGDVSAAKASDSAAS